MKIDYRGLVTIAMCLTAFGAVAQDVERARPEGWDKLVPGARFMDRFMPIPIKGELTSDTWGVDAVKPRDITNGIEDNEWSYWGGNIKQDSEGKYHMFVCRWLEDGNKGHMDWPQSETVRAVSDDLLGPYKVAEVIGHGHNSEVFQLKDGKYVLYVMGGYYISDKIDGPWTKGKFEFDRRDRKIIEGLSNLSFAQREDGSYLMVCRGGGMWISRTGISPYKQVTNGRVYPKGSLTCEDPVLWRDHIQYNMIVNDWKGRIAYYLRSKDGINWKADPGEAYMPGIAVYEDGTKIDWYKYERIKIYQDEYGRAIQANFAVIDYSKWEDKANDIHSSKNISIPLAKGRLLTILDKQPITPETTEIRVKVEAEKGFDPHKDIHLDSLRFGASEEIDFGRGSKVLKTEKAGKDLIITFEGNGNGLSDDNFAAKLLGKTANGKLLFGYARLPWLNYNEPILSARMPRITADGKKIKVEVENLGQAASGDASVHVSFKDTTPIAASGNVASLVPYEKTELEIDTDRALEKGKKYSYCVEIKQPGIKTVFLNGTVSF